MRDCNICNMSNQYQYYKIAGICLSVTKDATKGCRRYDVVHCLHSRYSRPHPVCGTFSKSQHCSNPSVSNSLPSTDCSRSLSIALTRQCRTLCPPRIVLEVSALLYIYIYMYMYVYTMRSNDGHPTLILQGRLCMRVYNLDVLSHMPQRSHENSISERSKRCYLYTLTRVASSYIVHT